MNNPYITPINIDLAEVLLKVLELNTANNELVTVAFKKVDKSESLDMFNTIIEHECDRLVLLN